MADLVVLNTGPVIALGGIGHLDIIRKLFGRVVAPEAVAREIMEGGPSSLGAREFSAADWIERVKLKREPEPLLAKELGSGEAEAISLAILESPVWLIIDDCRARRIAEIAYRVKVKGTAGLLVEAKRRALIRALRPLLEAIRANGYYLSDRLVKRACQEAGE